MEVSRKISYSGLTELFHSIILLLLRWLPSGFRGWEGVLNFCYFSQELVGESGVAMVMGIYRKLRFESLPKFNSCNASKERVKISLYVFLNEFFAPNMVW